MPKAINIIFDGPPGPEAGRFVEVETDDGKSINAGEWIEKDGYWALRITELPGMAADEIEKLEAENTRLQEKLLQTQYQSLVTMADAIQGIDSVLNDREEG